MSTYPAIEPITYRWRPKGAVLWIYDPTPEWIEEHKPDVEIEPIYGCDQIRRLRSQLERIKAALNRPDLYGDRVAAALAILGEA